MLLLKDCVCHAGLARAPSPAEGAVVARAEAPGAPRLLYDLGCRRLQQVCISALPRLASYLPPLCVGAWPTVCCL